MVVDADQPGHGQQRLTGDPDTQQIRSHRPGRQLVTPAPEMLAEVAVETARSPGIRSSVIITADRPEDVDALIRRAQAAGATVTKEPTDAEFFEGRDAYFADPEGNYWEVAWAAEDNPVTAAARRAAGIATDIQSE